MDNKKVLHVGITAPTYSSEAISQAFTDVFGQTVYFDWQAHRFNYGAEQMRVNLLKVAHEEKPDIIFLHINHNSETLAVDTYKELSEIGFTITYTEDVRDDITWFETITPLVGISLFTNIDDVEKLKAKGINNAAYLPVSYNDIWYKKQKKTGRFYGDIVFLGNNYVDTNTDFPQAQQRQDMVAALKKEFGDEFQAYGRGQENRALNPQEAVEAYNNAKIAICHNNFIRKGYQSDRGLNAMGCGCATIMHYCYTDGQYDFLNMSGSIWNTFDELIALCKLYLGNEWALEELQKYQYKTVTENHRWINRVETIRDLINKTT